MPINVYPSISTPLSLGRQQSDSVRNNSASCCLKRDTARESGQDVRCPSHRRRKSHRFNNTDQRKMRAIINAPRCHRAGRYKDGGRRETTLHALSLPLDGVDEDCSQTRGWALTQKVLDCSQHRGGEQCRSTTPSGLPWIAVILMRNRHQRYSRRSHLSPHNTLTPASHASIVTH